MRSKVNVAHQLPRWAAAIVQRPPKSGDGFHPWLLRASLAFMRCDWNQDDIFNFLQTAAATCGRTVSAKEISDAIARAEEISRFPSATVSPSPKWPNPDHELIEAVLDNSGGLVDLWEESPVRFEDNNGHAEDVIDTLFPGNPLLCCGQSNSSFATRARSEWQGSLSDAQFIVPSPMTAKTGLTRDGKESAHCLANTGSRRFLVIEFDTGSFDEHAARLLHLAEHAPMALTVHSGGKSLHGWFYCQDQPEDRLLNFMRYAVSLGADRATWTRSQFVRMPGGKRDNGTHQAIYFFNPSVIG